MRSDEALSTLRLPWTGTERARIEPGTDQSLSPYFYVETSDGETERLPLKATSADVRIAGTVAAVTIRQVFANEGRRPIETVYLFPASTRAAVHAMRMKIGSRTIEARIDRREVARARYEAARREGRRAGLLEQQRSNVFTTNVANVMPGDRIEVELEYTEWLVPEEGEYEFVYPTVVGPRYGGGADGARDGWIANPYRQEGLAEPYRFDLTVELATGIPIRKVRSPSHRIGVTYDGAARARVRLEETGGGNRDFVLRYRLSGDRIETGLILSPPSRPGEPGTFALLVEPPVRTADAEIPPREYIFLVDVSGSMNGFPIETAKALLRDLISRLRPTDYFNVVLFAGGSEVMSPDGSLPATPGNRRLGIETVERQNARGGTELMAGLLSAYGIPRGPRAVSRTILVVSDGFVGIEARAFRFVRQRLGEANLFAFGIGTSVNRALIDGISRAGLGEPFVVADAKSASAQSEKFREYVERPVWTSLRLSTPGFDASDISPQQLPDLMASRPILVFGRYTGQPRGAIELTGETGGGSVTRRLEVRPSDAHGTHPAVRYLWARKWIEALDDQLDLGGGPEVTEAVAALGLEYGLVTRFTSFLAVDSQIANRTGDLATSVQPLPLPEGVRNPAVGGASISPQLLQNLAAGRQVTGALSLVPEANSDASGVTFGGATSTENVWIIDGINTSNIRGGEVTVSARRPMIDQMSNTSHTVYRYATIGEYVRGCCLVPPCVARWWTRRESRSVATPTPTPVGRLVIADILPANLADAPALAAAIESRMASCHTARRTGDGVLRLRLLVNSTGTIVKVEILEGSGALADCLLTRLAGLSSSARPEGAPLGSCEIALRVLWFVD